ncbi:MAG: Ig-like domain-containing protein, partial [Proteobacteria bacterium]|nr:Ig-like domain-containing protein [Pseudomonadota bacterium]
MKAIVIKLICPLLLLMILGCSEDFMAAKVKDHSTAATELSTTTDAAGNFSAALDPSSKSTQTMRATSGAVSGSAIAMPSGSLSIAVNVTIGEGATLASASTNKQIGLADNPATAAGPAVSFVPSSSVQASSPFTLAIPITASGSLALADSSIQSENLIVIYNWMNVVNGVATYSVGLLTRQDLTIGTKSVQFQTTKFGTYQLAVTQTKVIQKVEIPTAEPPVLKSEQPAVPVLLPPASLSYSVPSSRYTPGVAIAANMPSLSGGTPTSFSVLPALPAGLALHAVTGIISGTPVVQEASKTYTITALNTSGSATAQIVVAVIAASVPAVVLTSSAGTSTATSPIPIVATFSESVTDFALSDIVVTNGTAEGFSGSGTSYTFIVVPVEGVSMTVNIAAGVANGSDGSVNTAAAQLVRIYDITAPTGFALQSPSSGATVTTTPTLTWNASTDASSLTYTLYYNSGGGACTSGTSIPNLTSLSYTLSGLSSGTSYNWCVVATDVLGNSTSSGSFAFTSQAPAFTCDTGSFTAACVLTSGRSILDGTSVNIDGDLTISPGGSLYVSNAPYSTVLNVAGHLHLSGGYLLGNFIINAGSLTIDSGTAINATLLGAAGGVSNGDGAGSGPGSTTGGGYGYPSSGGGGGCHAGYCGANSTGGGWQSTTFGDGIFSVALYRGAGGGAGFSAAGGAGGGTISITVTGATTINGSISADGESGSAGGLYGGGGGAGGSIKIVTGTIAGTGSVTANGGAGGIGTSISGGGGSGGRIRIESFNKFSGEISASGGINSNIPHARGGDGTYTQNISGGYCDTYASPLCTISTKTWAGTDEIISFSQNLTLSGSGNLAAATKNQITSLTIQPKGFSVNVAGDLIVDASAIWAPAGAVPLQALDILTSLKAQTIQIDGSLVGNFPLIFAKN